MVWALDEGIQLRLEQLQTDGRAPPVEVLSRFEARVAEIEARSRDGQPPKNLLVVGSTAQIKVEGILTKRPDYLADWLGIPNTTYTSIVQAVASAEADPTVKRIEYLFDSPGGTVDGLPEALAAMSNGTKPSTAKATLATSAAYALATKAGKIEAAGPMAQFGSVGVVVTKRVDPSTVAITSTNAPNKRPDPSTEEGKAAIRAELDPVHDWFASEIASGRGVKTAVVNETYGKGATLLAAEAKSRGMIDSVARLVSSSKGVRAESENAETLPEQKNMTLAELKATHPEIFEAARQEGVLAERDRASAHLIRGTAAGALDVAIKAVREGTVMTEAMRADYDVAAQAKLAAVAKGTESAKVGDDTKGGSIDATVVTKDVGDTIADALFPAGKVK